jgi:hypothetical protein
MSATKQKKRIFPAYFVSKPNKTKQSQWLLEGLARTPAQDPTPQQQSTTPRNPQP